MSTPPLRSSKTIRKGIEERVSTPYPMASTWNDSVKHITSSWGVLILITRVIAFQNSARSLVR